MLYLIVNNTNLQIGDRYMRTDDFNFDLPEELIAQHPLEQRDHSRLLVLDKHSGNITLWIIAALQIFVVKTIQNIIKVF